MTKAIDEKGYDVAKMLIAYNAGPDFIDRSARNFRTALYFAVDNNNYGIVKLLIYKSTNVNAIHIYNGKSSQTTLNLALSEKDTDQRIIDYIMSKGGRRYLKIIFKVVFNVRN